KETMKKYASSVKTFLRYCADNEIIEDALINKLRRQKIFNISYSETPRYNFLNDINEKERDAIVFNQAKKPFEFAWLSLMRETGARIGEIMNLKINMVIQKEGQQYVEVVLDGKTGRRVVPIINSMAPLLKWLELHPSKDNPNARVFCGYRYSPNDGKRYYAPLKPMSHVYFGHRLRKIADSLGIKKNVRCQLFRHLKAVSMKKKNVTEPVANELMGWSKNSKMYGYYGAGNPDAKINAVFELAGIKRQENKELEGQFKVCQNCHEINAAEKAYCQRCSSELSFSKPSTEIPEIKAMIERLEKLEQLQQYNIAEANRKITAMSQQDYEKLLIKLEEK
ncbi:MAG: tyrosine-type recombinase/integrase, partial [Candidatus Diapherotrites archaeon]|nr:tyrosine-type recombinase/integrase [Candidatus Diapherotrites archaeon]